MDTVTWSVHIQPVIYLVSWLESWASLTKLCTSMSVLSLVPERSFSAPICSRTADRCSAVHFRTKGFRWLQKEITMVKGSENDLDYGQGQRMGSSVCDPAMVYPHLGEES